ncbi:MAG TPA: DUF86 domain-containing protein [Hydrogenothermaceae bacterium]|nr:DUF86 domain-containing protein [Hydrogenothermaceae bacterium]
MIPKIVDTKFLNEKAAKAKTFIKKIKQILSLGEEEFSKNPMYSDRTKYYLVVLTDELEQIACHILEVYFQQKFNEKCLEKLASEEILDAKLSRSLYDLYKLKETLLKENMVYTPENMYHTVSDIISTLDKLLILELAQILKELKEKQPSLKVPVNFKKVNQHISTIKSNLLKLDTFLKYPEEEFLNTPMFIDRSRYFIVVITDSSLWICRHLLRKLGERKTDDCFYKLWEKNIIDKDTADLLGYFASNRELFANPTKNINLKEFYTKLKLSKDIYIKFIKSILKYVLEEIK